jgi:hypothetical protein
MSQQELLKRVVAALDAASVDYMITGSVASSLQGEPRSTHDIDLVVTISPSAAKHLLCAFPPPDYYLDEAAILQAIRQRGMFNLLDLREGTKVDFWLLKDEPFDRSRFSRKCVEEVAGARLKVSRPEDTILMKLKWAREAGGSEKQFTDALRVYEVQSGQLDLGYIERWACELGVEESWQKLKREAEPG